MKKVIVTMAVLLAFTFVLSAANEQTSEILTGIKSENAPAQTLVSLDLSSAENDIVEFWFAASDSNGGRMPSSGKGTVSLKQQVNGTEFDNTGEDLYACWYIRSTSNVDVDLWMTQALQDSEGTNPIRWTVSGKEGETNISIDSNETTTGDVVTYTANAPLNADSIKLTVATNQGDWSSIPAGKKYTAYLMLGIKTE